MILHVACLPFPSHQGTQAALDAMLRVSATTDRTTHLLAYAQAGYLVDAPYEIHRIADFPKVRSLRSGPSWGKVALDARCVVETRRLVDRLRPRAIVAHHLEAALAVLAARVAPAYYVAHTSLSQELPVYFPSWPARLIGAAANAVERLVCARVDGVAAVAPSLARLLGAGVGYLPVPWGTSSVADRPTRRVARAQLGLAPDVPVCLYAGNLDPYQGWEHLVAALRILRRTRPEALLLIATESDPSPCRRLAGGLGLADAVRFHRLDGERARKLIHSAADLAWVPRRTEGGLPIKMLEAFSRRVPVIAMKRATAALPVQDACIVVPDDDANALAAAAERVLEDDRCALALRERALLYLAIRHGAEAFTSAFRELVGEPDANTH